MRHVNKTIIDYLKKIVNKVKIINIAEKMNNVSKTHECETCAMIKMHRKISRSFAKKETSDTLCNRVTYDLMFLNKSELNDHE